jgi:hypothetical protein
MASIFNIVSDVQNVLYPDGRIQLNVEQMDQNTYMLFIVKQNSNSIGEVEFFYDNDPECPYVASIFNQGPVSRKTLDKIVGAIMERV